MKALRWEDLVPPCHLLRPEPSLRVQGAATQRQRKRLPACRHRLLPQAPIRAEGGLLGKQPEAPSRPRPLRLERERGLRSLTQEGGSLGQGMMWEVPRSPPAPSQRLACAYWPLRWTEMEVLPTTHARSPPRTFQTAFSPIPLFSHPAMSASGIRATPVLPPRLSWRRRCRLHLVEPLG